MYGIGEGHECMVVVGTLLVARVGLRASGFNVRPTTESSTLPNGVTTIMPDRQMVLQYRRCPVIIVALLRLFLRRYLSRIWIEGIYSQTLLLIMFLLLLGLMIGGLQIRLGLMKKMVLVLIMWILVVLQLSGLMMYMLTVNRMLPMISMLFVVRVLAVDSILVMMVIDFGLN